MNFPIINNSTKIRFSNLALFLILATISFVSCESDSSTTAVVEEQAAALSVSEIIKNNPKVKLAELEKKSVSQSIRCTGMIELPPTELVFVHARTSGAIRYLKYIPGDYVKKGALLAIIENPKLIEEQRMLMETKADLAFAENDFERKRQLKEGNATSERNYQEALAKKNRLRATYEGLKSELSVLGINIEKLEQQNNYQSSISVYAASAGYVHTVNVNMGEMIQPETKLMEIANNGHMHLELNVLSKDAPTVKLGQKVRFSLPSSSEVLEAEVVKINPLVDAETNTMNVHCHIEDKKAKGVKPGVFANATILGQPREVLGLPMSSVIKVGEKFFAFKETGGLLQKQLLENVSIIENWVSFSNDSSGKWVVEGAYYLDGGE